MSPLPRAPGNHRLPDLVASGALLHCHLSAHFRRHPPHLSAAWAPAQVSKRGCNPLSGAFMVCYGSALCSAGPGPWIWEGRRAGGGAAQGHSLEMKSKGGGRPRSLQTSDRRAKGVREFVTGKPGETISSSAPTPLITGEHQAATGLPCPPGADWYRFPGPSC